MWHSIVLLDLDQDLPLPYTCIIRAVLTTLKAGKQVSVITCDFKNLQAVDLLIQNSYLL
jgi:hypothetical protein